MKAINILHLISSSGLLGAERVLLNLADHSRAAGLGVTIGVFKNSQNPDTALAEEARAKGFEVCVFPCRGRFDRNAIQMIRDCLDKVPVNILHSHNYKSNYYARMALSGKAVRWVVTNHGRRSGVKLLLYNLLDMLVVRRADRLVAVSGKIAAKMKLAGVERERIRLIENGIDLGGFAGRGSANGARESLGIRKEAIVIGTVGALTKEKGHAHLLEAVQTICAQYPTAVFLLVGDGNQRAVLEEIAGKRGVREKVIFAGMRKDVPEILSMLDVFVLPSLNEGLPLALLEAQAARIPTVATSVGAIPNVVQDRVTGILIPPEDPAAIAGAVSRILSDKQKGLEMAEKGFARVRDNYSSEKMASRYLSVYHELLS